jgi:hypothetical protein
MHDNLIDFILDYDENDPEDVDRILEFAGIDKDELQKEGMELVNRLLEERNEKNKNLLDL